MFNISSSLARAQKAIPSLSLKKNAQSLKASLRRSLTGSSLSVLRTHSTKDLLRSNLMFSFLSQFFGFGTKSMGCPLAPKTAPEGQEIATVAGGCFWGLQLAIDRIPGVTASTVGYTAGKVPNPTYDAVCGGNTGHAEAVQCYFDPKECSYADIMDVFFARVDPTTMNRQGNDVGTQYRSAIYFHNEEQKKIAQQKIDEWEKKHGKKVVTQLEPAQDYYIAEEYHQKYLEKGGRFGRGQSAKKGCTDPIRCYG